MVPATGASYEKAFFTNVDTGGVFYVQFNPKEFKLDEKANWKASDEHEEDKPLLTYEKGEPSVVTMDLIFDSTDTGDNVNGSYVEPLRDFLTADVKLTDNEGDKMSRPPYCKFTWGSFNFECVVEKVSVTFMMFKPDGTPIRAKVQVGLKERNRNVNGGGGGSVTLSALGTMFSGASSQARTYQTHAGETLTSIAGRTGANWQDIAAANDIDDPMDLPPGQDLVIPANSQLAQVLAMQSRGRQRGNWRPTNRAEGGGPRARGGQLSGPSSFDEPVALSYDVDPGGIADAYTSFGPLSYDTRGDSELSGGTAGAGADYGGFGASDDAGSFDNLATPDEQGAGPTAQGYGDYGDSQAAGGTAGSGADYGGYGDSADSRAFRDTASPDEQGSGPTAQSYGGYGDSQAADPTANDGAGYGGFGDSQAAGGTAGAGAGGYGGYGESGGAGSFRNDASPDDSGMGAHSAQGYGGHGDSQAADTSANTGASYGGYGESGGAGDFRDSASPDGSGMGGHQAQGYGGHGDSQAAGGTAGTGAGGYGGYGESGGAGDFRDSASPDGSGMGEHQGQGYGGHGGSDAAAGGGAGGAHAGGGHGAHAGSAHAGSADGVHAGGAHGAHAGGDGAAGGDGPAGRHAAMGENLSGLDPATRARILEARKAQADRMSAAEEGQGPNTMAFAEAVRRGQKTADEGDSKE